MGKGVYVPLNRVQFSLFDSGKGCENHPSSLEEGKMLLQHDSITKIIQFFWIMLSLTILIKL